MPIPLDYFIDSIGNNLFHLLLLRFRYLPPTRLATVKALIDKYPYFVQLIDVKSSNTSTPLCELLAYNRNEDDRAMLVDFVDLFFRHGASTDYSSVNGTSYLHLAIYRKHLALLETLLRAGCRRYSFGFPLDKVQSPLYWCLVSDDRKCDSRSIRMIELLLAFGYDLQNELFLYTIQERPVEFTSPEYAKLRNTRSMDLEILAALRELRRSNKLLSLQRQCRNTIRRHLKVRADEVIGNLDCIPDLIKSFLLVRDEQPLLAI